MGDFVDITVALQIAKPPEAVAGIMFDPRRDPSWIGGAKRVELVTADPLAIGAHVRRYGAFMGRKFSWVTELTAHEPARRLEMKFIEGPMRGDVSYVIAPTQTGTEVRIQNNADAAFAMPGMAWMLRRSVHADLKRLKAIVESAR